MIMPWFVKTIARCWRGIRIFTSSGEGANGEEAITLPHTLQPDVVLMDMNMPQLNGIEATAVIKRNFPDMVVAGLSVNADRENREAMIQAGAATLLTKEAPVEELYHAIQAAVKSLLDRKSSTRAR
jgi:DNA-binding NarL/FixJ family response regulator